ncbi:MAG: LysR family transcriptional regulator [Methylococcales symbiont of Hymedesmia sp. n. MRB-2018]|nr:MAG: LysR family transcriptional regulator [Methylococcales symbiont of Hymedesmia sp. n. MRB-2018]KAF3984583.1 MAG: LysR family transcriptional regulator [Methylococcales symbiont of Hymedesmia sp. n. MRB-2018]
MDKLASMNVFVRVAKQGSFAGAARELNISRAMATKHIMSLEKMLDTRLFNRTTRSLHLTEVGVTYLQKCQQILFDVEEMESAITHLQVELCGVLKISAPPVIGATHIAPAIAEFLKIHQGLSVDVILQGSQADIVDEGIDIGIILGALPDSSLVARKLASSRLVVCGSPDYFKQFGTPDSPEDLTRHSCLVNWAVPPYNKWRFSDGRNVKEIKVSGRMESNVADPVRKAANKGLGMVMLPHYIVGRDIEKGKLRVVLNQYKISPLEIYAIYPHRKYLSVKVRRFLDFLQDWMPARVGML